MKSICTTITLYLLFSVSIFSQGYICAVGGGTEDYGSWSDKPYGWIVEKSDSGKVLVLSYSDASDWIPDYFMSLGADTAYNIKIGTSAAADMQSTYDELITADAVFIKGGDQWQYVSLWKGTKTENAIRYVFNNGGVISGTSAGAAVLGEIVFTAENGTVYSDETLIDPFNYYVRLDNDFLNLVPGVLFDTHFIERARSGRLIGFMINTKVNFGLDVTAVGLDDRTALCIDTAWVGTAYGSGAVHIYHADAGTIFQCDADSFNIENLRADILTENWQYDFSNNRVSYIPPTAKQMDTTRAEENPLTDLWLTGNNSVTDALNAPVPEFVYKYDPVKIGIISHSGYETQAEQIKTYFDNAGRDAGIIYISTASLTDGTAETALDSCDAFIFAGSDNSIFSKLADTSLNAAKVLYAKLRSGVPCLFIGESGMTAGEYYTDNSRNDPSAAFYGLLEYKKGLGLYPELLFQPLLYADSDFYETRIASPLYGMMSTGKRIGLWLDESDYIIVNAEGESLHHKGGMPIMLADASHVSYTDSSTYTMGASPYPRQAVAFENLRLFVSQYEKTYLINEEILPVRESNGNDQPYEYKLYNNFPNPFNGETKIKFYLPRQSETRLELYDINGRLISVLAEEILSQGFHIRSLNTNKFNLASGVYFYSLTADGRRLTGSMLLLK